jgi:hypothetical protein
MAVHLERPLIGDFIAHILAWIQGKTKDLMAGLFWEKRKNDGECKNNDVGVDSRDSMQVTNGVRMVLVWSLR